MSPQKETQVVNKEHGMERPGLGSGDQDYGEGGEQIPEYSALGVLDDLLLGCLAKET
jgi:hypothetical protein